MGKMPVEPNYVTEAECQASHSRYLRIALTVVGLIVMLVVGSVGWAIFTERQIGAGVAEDAAHKVRLKGLEGATDRIDSEVGRSFRTIDRKIDKLTEIVGEIHTKQEVLINKVEMHLEGQDGG